jgi:hypothetical protein
MALHRSGRTNLSLSAIIFMSGLLIRAPLICLPPSDGLYNADELVLSLSILDRWLGLPATNLYWPAVPQELGAFLFFAPEFSVALLTDRSLDKLTYVIFTHYQDPSSIILLLRIFSMLAGAATAVALYQLTKYLSESVIAGVTAAAISTLLPLSLRLSVMAMADAVALMFCAWAARWLIISPARPLLVGFMSAAAVSTKAAMGIWLLPIFVGGILFIYQHQGARQMWNTVLRCILAGISGTIMFFPYLWIDPLRTAKNIIGAAIDHAGKRLPDIDVFSIAISSQFILISFICLSLAAGLLQFRIQRFRYVGMGTALVMCGILLFVLKLGLGYWKYMIGAIIPGLILCAILSIRRERAVTLFFLPAAILGFGAISLTDELRAREGIGLRQILQIAEEKCERGEMIWLQDVALSLQYDRLRLPRATVLQIVSYFENSDKSRAVVEWIEAAGVSRPAAIALQSAFDEREQVALARWRGLSVANLPAPNCQMQLFKSTLNTPDIAIRYARGSLTTKTQEDVRMSLEQPTNAPINVVGETTVFGSIGVPIGVTTRNNDWAIGGK